MSEPSSKKGSARIAITTNNSLGLEVNPGRIRISVYDEKIPIIDKSKILGLVFFNSVFG